MGKEAPSCLGIKLETPGACQTMTSHRLSCDQLTDSGGSRASLWGGDVLWGRHAYNPEVSNAVCWLRENGSPYGRLKYLHQSTWIRHCSCRTYNVPMYFSAFLFPLERWFSFSSRFPRINGGPSDPPPRPPPYRAFTLDFSPPRVFKKWASLYVY